MFYEVKKEPIPSNTRFDVVLKTVAAPSVHHLITVNIPKNFPYAAPILTMKSAKKTDKNLVFRFLEKKQWRPAMGICEVLIEACNVMSSRDIEPRRPRFPKLCPPIPLVKPKSKGAVAGLLSITPQKHVQIPTIEKTEKSDK